MPTRKLHNPPRCWQCASSLVLAAIVASILGCGGSDAEPDSPSTTAMDEKATTSEVAEAELMTPPGAIELTAEKLLSAQLPTDLLREGWVRLFDGHSLDGWFVVNSADWRVEDGVIKVSQGQRSYLCTNLKLADYELQLEFRATPNTNSGVFLRTSPTPQDVAIDCLELNIAPEDNPFPTGSFVERKKVATEVTNAFDPTEWHTYRVRLEGEQVDVLLDGEPIMSVRDNTSLQRGHISLQHNTGEVEFRNILLRPLNAKPLAVDVNWEQDWTMSEKEPRALQVEVLDNGLHLTGGLGQLQSKADFGDFFLQAQYTLAQPKVNSGIFFRCIRDSMLDGYECQVNHAVQDGDPMLPADSGAGGIFRREPARIVIGDGTKRTFLTLAAAGNQFVTWVNGIQVAEFEDRRDADQNPRRGTRLEPGPISLQGHDPTTDVIFHDLQVAELR